MPRYHSILMAVFAFLAFMAGHAKGADVPTVDITAALPVIPDAKFNLKDFGGVGDYKTDNTPAFNKAVAAIEAAGGGHLIVPAGTYKTLPFRLTSKMDLHLEAGSKIKAPDKFADYGIPDPNLTPTGGRNIGRVAALISATNVTDVAITGSGMIDGSGQEFWIWSEKAARLYPNDRTYVARPVLINISGQRLHFDGVTLTNSPNFHLVPRGSDITIENLRIVAPADAPNTDAMDPGGQRIVIRNCEIDTGDDNVAMQQGSSDILIENLTCLHGHGISIGSGTTRGFSHMIVRDCTFDGADNALRIKSYRGSGGDVHDIWYSNITIKNVRHPIDINMLYNGNADAPSDVGPRQPTDQTAYNIPNFHDIHFSNITVTRSPMAGRILGVPENPPHDFTFSNVTFNTDRGLLVEDGGANITFSNVTIDALVGAPLVLDNATVKWNGITKTGPIGGSPNPFYSGERWWYSGGAPEAFYPGN